MGCVMLTVSLSDRGCRKPEACSSPAWIFWERVTWIFPTISVSLEPRGNSPLHTDTCEASSTSCIAYANTSPSDPTVDTWFGQQCVNPSPHMSLCGIFVSVAHWHVDYFGSHQPGHSPV